MANTAELTLTEFLLARIAEDEQRAEVHDGEWTAHVLAVCTALREVVARHHDGRDGDYIKPFCVTCSDDENLAYLPCDTLRALASIWSSHDDYPLESTDAPTVCIAHGRFIPCRKDGEHRYTSNPFWVKSVRDYQNSPIENLTWEPAQESGGRA